MLSAKHSSFLNGPHAGKLCILGPFHSGRARSSYRNRHVFYVHGLPFYVCRTLASITILRTVEYLIHWHWIPHNMTLDHRTHFTGNKCWREPMTMGSLVISYPSPTSCHADKASEQLADVRGN